MSKHRYGKPKKLVLCECTDRGCPVHHGKSECNKLGTARLYRVDMDDHSGTKMCLGCANDAMDSGVFR